MQNKRKRWNWNYLLIPLGVILGGGLIGSSVMLGLSIYERNHHQNKTATKLLQTYIDIYTNYNKEYASKIKMYASLQNLNEKIKQKLDKQDLSVKTELQLMLSKLKKTLMIGFFIL